MTRRLLTLIPWIGVLLFLLHVVRVQDHGVPVTVGVFAVVFLGLFRVFEKIVLIERRAFCCVACGYELQGLTEHRCPECGTDFDPSERERILERIGAPTPKAKRSWLIIVILVLLVLGLVVNVLVFRRVRARRAPAAPTPSVAPVGDNATTDRP